MKGELWRFTRLLFGQWWFTAFTILGAISTISTFVPAFYSRYAVPRWVPLVVFVLALFFASFSIYLADRRDHSAEVTKLKVSISELNRAVASLKVKPYDEEKQAKAKTILGSLSSRQRDLLRYILYHENPSDDMVRHSNQLGLSQIREDLYGLMQIGLVVQNKARFSVATSWIEVFKELLYPRREDFGPPAYE